MKKITVEVFKGEVQYIEKNIDDLPVELKPKKIPKDSKIYQAVVGDNFEYAGLKHTTGSEGGYVIGEKPIKTWICEGSIVVTDCEMRNSYIGLKCNISGSVTIEDSHITESVIIGNVDIRRSLFFNNVNISVGGGVSRSKIHDSKLDTDIIIDCAECMLMDCIVKSKCDIRCELKAIYTTISNYSYISGGVVRIQNTFITKCILKLHTAFIENCQLSVFRIETLDKIELKRLSFNFCDYDTCKPLSLNTRLACVVNDDSTQIGINRTQVDFTITYYRDLNKEVNVSLFYSHEKLKGPGNAYNTQHVSLNMMEHLKLPCDIIHSLSDLININGSHYERNT